MNNFEKIKRLRETLEQAEDSKYEAELRTAEGEARRLARNKKARRAAAARREAYESIGMHRVRGGSGGQYWE
jgi:hypothetical protein